MVTDLGYLYFYSGIGQKTMSHTSQSKLNTDVVYSCSVSRNGQTDRHTDWGDSQSSLSLCKPTSDVDIASTYIGTS